MLNDETVADARLPLFYQRPVPLDVQRHATAGLKPGIGFGFARHTNSVPVLMDELFVLQAHYPIVFLKDPNPGAFAVLGFADRINLFVEPDGTWRHGFQPPAYVRRFPFVLAQEPASDSFTLCVEESVIEDTAPAERALFADGQPTNITRQALEFCRIFQAQHQRMQEFTRALIAHDLLMEQRADASIKRSGQTVRTALQGFHIVDEARFNRLPDSVFLDWRQRGWIAAIYAHILSQHRWPTLVDIASNSDGAA
jgi:hypothetical protein